MKGYLKRMLSVTMAVIMVLSCWVWVTPENLKAEAANSYKVTIGYYTKRRVESGTLYTKVWYTTRSGSIGYVQASSTGCRSTGTTKFDITNIPGFPYYIMCWLEGSLDYEENNSCRTEWNYASINDGDDIFPDQYSFVYESLIGNNTNTGYWLDDKTKAILLNGYSAPESADHMSVFDWEDPLEGQIGEILPSGYDFDNSDRWAFSNIEEKIDKKYYRYMYGKNKGDLLHSIYEIKEHGHCYGMATSTASILSGNPKTTDFYSEIYKQSCDSLLKIDRNAMNSKLGITAKEFIKYCHIYQYSSSIAKQRFSNVGIEKVYNAVKENSNNYKTTGIAIDFKSINGSGNHTVYAVGVDGNDIIVNDSNSELVTQRIKVNGDEWSYSYKDLSWSSDDIGSWINYISDIETPYACIWYDKTVAAANESYSSNSVALIDKDKNLIYTNSNNLAFEQKDKMLEVQSTELTEDISGTTKESLYWLDNTETLLAENTSAEPAEIKVAGNEVKITAELPSNATTEMKVADGEVATADFTVSEGDELSVTFTTLDENNEFVDVEVSGTASGDTVTATETETGVAVEGFDSITITYTDVDGEDEKTITNIGGTEINITVDEENNDITTDYICDHADEDNNCICDYCEDALSHTEQTIPAVPASCTTTGLTEGKKCSVCGEILTAQTQTAMLPHTYGTWQTLKAPTCTDTGVETRSCSCGKEETRTVKATGHNYGDDNVCDNCGEIKACSCNCHKSGFIGFIWKIINFFQKLFKINPVCECGKAHY